MGAPPSFVHRSQWGDAAPVRGFAGSSALEAAIAATRTTVTQPFTGTRRLVTLTHTSMGQRRMIRSQ